MSKYLQLLKINWENGLVYRTSVIIWRLRQFLSTVMALTLWTILLSQQTSGFGYTQAQMVTYIFSISILDGFIFATALQGLGNQIYSGQFSFQLLKPINLYLYFATEEIADKLKNVGFIAIETIILYLIFKPELIFPSAEIGIIFVAWTVLGIVLHFFIQLLFGALGFWTPETWGPRFLFWMFLDFTAGKMFPLDILPTVIQKLIFFTPFPYMSFLQIQLMLGKIPTTEIIPYTIWFGVWLGILGILTKIVWSRGIKNYSASGN